MQVNVVNKSYQLTFYKSELNQYNFILKNNSIKDKISLFLLKYVSIESFYKKLLVAEKEKTGRKLTQKEKKQLRVVSSDVKRVLLYYDIKYSDDLIERIFGSNDKNYMECSIKKLRDRLVHSVNDNVLKTILERYEQIDSDIEAFLSLFNIQ